MLFTWRKRRTTKSRAPGWQNAVHQPLLWKECPWQNKTKMVTSNVLVIIPWIVRGRSLYSHIGGSHHWAILWFKYCPITACASAVKWKICYQITWPLLFPLIWSYCQAIVMWTDILNCGTDLSASDWSLEFLWNVSHFQDAYIFSLLQYGE